METGCILVDYLTFSLKPDPCNKIAQEDLTQDFLLSFMGLRKEFSNFHNTGSRGGYTTCYQYNGLSLYTCDPSDPLYQKKGVAVSMSGKGCRYYENLRKGFAWATFFKRLINLSQLGYKLSVSRFDQAVDDKEGFLDLDLITAESRSFQFVSTSRKHSPIEQFNGTQLCSRGYTYGSRGCRTFIRIYDKALEQKQEGHWVRFEIETKFEQAMRLINAMVEAGENYGAFFGGYIMSVLRFVDFDSSNITRCTVKGWWQKFCGTVKRYSLRIMPYISNSIHKMERHIYDNWSANITTVISAIGLPEFVEQVTQYGASKIKQRHLDALQNATDKVFSSVEQWKHERPISLDLFLASCS